MKRTGLQRRGRGPRHLGLDEIVDLAGEGSFPASDPPSWSPIHLGPPGGELEPCSLFRDVVQQLRDDVFLLSGVIGERNDRSRPAKHNLDLAADAIESRMKDARLPVRRRPVDGAVCNVEAVLRGESAAGESVVVGAHYDTPSGSPGADDNASGVALLIALAHALRGARLARTVRLVAFAAEEPPHLGGPSTGSAAYVRALKREGPRVMSMLSLEGLGAFVDEPAPWPLRLSRVLRSEVAIVGDRRARALLGRVEASFASAREEIAVAPLRHPALFATVRVQSSSVFARAGIPALLLTSTAPLRWRRRPAEKDTPDRLDYERLASISVALARAVSDLARPDGADSSRT